MNIACNSRFALFCIFIGVLLFVSLGVCFGQTWLDNNNFYSDDSTAENIRRSDHFRIAWGKQPLEPLTEEFVQLNLQHFEYMYKKLNGAAPYGLGLYAPCVKKPTDGNNYRFDLYVTNTHGETDGAFATAWQSSEGLGQMACYNSAMAVSDPPSFTLEHEYSHPVTIGPVGGGLTGEWGEGTSNWCGIQVQDNAYMPLLCNEYWLTVPHGKEMYWNTPFLETVLEEPNFGPAAIAYWISNGGAARYIFNSMADMVTWSPDHYNAIKNVVGKMAAKSAGVDFKRRDQILKNFNYDPRTRYCWPMAEAGSTTWYRIAWELAPSQAGYNIIPLTAAANATVTVNLKGICNPMRGSDWRACLVAVSSKGDSRYSSFWNTGSNSIKLSTDETLYLTVAATPDFFNFDFSRDTATNIVKEPMAYEISLTNATITEPTNGSTSGLVLVPNGGGYRASTATVASTAYVGPNARVLGSAQVLGNARIEDYAVVQDSAQVRDYAVVSGHALVYSGGQVYGNAKVRDWATVSGQVSGNARVYDHAKINSPTTMTDNTSAKGNTCWYDGALSGYAIADGDCDDGALFDHGTAVGYAGWGANQEYDDALPDTGGLFAQYNFERPNAVYATDTYGMAWGYLMGGPTCSTLSDIYRSTVLALDGASQYIECPRNFNDVKDTTIAIWVKWSGTASDQRIWSMGNGSTKYMYLTPKDGTTGYLRFVISNGATTQYLDGTAALTADRWTHVAVSFSGNTGTLYVDGVAVDTDTAITLNPDDLNSANTLLAAHGNYIGRGNAGNYFQGSIDDFRLYSTVQTAAVVSGIAAQFTDRNAGPVTGVATPTTLWYKFDSTTGTTATDSSVNAKNGTVTNGAWTSGYTNNCLQFNGTSSRVTVPSLGASLAAFSITAWINVTSIPGGTSWNAATLCGTDNWGSGDWIAEILGSGSGDNAGKLQFTLNGAFEIYSATTFTSASGNQGQWVHVALIYDSVGGSARIYINGVLESSTSVGSQAANVSLIKIGSWAGSSRFYNGKIDDFRIYNRALNATELGFFMPADTAPPSPATSTWLIAPTTASETSITMSATKATDVSGVLYNFVCTAGGGHNSGWISSNQYSDNGLTAGTQYTYTVQTKDGKGYTGTVSAAQSATTRAVVTTPPTPNPATFAIAPHGLTTASVSMTATKGVSPTGLVEYKFTRISGTGGAASSNWQASPTYTFTGLTSGASYTYNVQMRDANGNTSTVSATSAAAVARDNTPPFISGANNLPIGTVFSTRPYVKPDGTLYMSAREATDPSGVQYYFHCSSGGGPDSGWRDSRVWTNTAAVADGTYTYQIKIRDKSAQLNESAYMGDETFSATVKNVYHTYTVSQLAALSDDCLVSFSGTVTAVASNYYTITSGGNSIKVMPNTVNGATNSSLLNRTASVKGGMWTYSTLGRTVTFASVAVKYTITASAGANGTISPSGTVLVDSGTNSTFQMNPDHGYLVDTVIVDGVSQGSMSSYTFGNVSANHTISVAFKTDPSPDGLLYYRFDQTSGSSVTDSSGNGKTGTLSGGYTWGSGKAGNCIALNGTSGYISIPSLGSLSSFTISTWVYLNALPGDFCEILTTDSWTTGSLHCHILPSGAVAFGVDGWDTSPYSTAVLSTGSWKHVALVFDGLAKTAKIYINGAQDTSVNLSTATAANLTSVKLGTWQGTQRFLNGKFDEYHIYGRALSAGEVQTLYTDVSYHTITASTGANGSVSPLGAVSVAYGATQAFTITPDTGYAVSQVTVDAVSQGAIAAYTFTNVTAAHTISAAFQRAYGVNNRSVLADSVIISKAVVVWGQVLSVNPGISFAISDGFNSTGVTVMINGTTLPTGFAVGKMVTVTGIVNADRSIQAQVIRVQ